MAALKAVQNCLMLQDGRILSMDILMHRDLRTRQSVLGTDLYTGTTGICYALAYGDAASKAGNPSSELRALCEASLTASSHESMLETGICHGHGAGIYLAAHLSALWNDQYMQMLGEHLAEHAGRILYTDRHFDLFSGSAGLLSALLALRGGAKAGKLDALIESTVDHLISHAHTSRGAMAWMSSIPSTGPNTGYAHGVSGIAHALLRAGVELNMKRAIDAAMSAERFLETCRFDGAGWRECEGDGAPAKMDMWCHGTPGITLFYLELAAVCPDERVKKTAAFALAETERVARFDNDSLCHGWLGNLEASINAQASAGTERTTAVQACLDELAERTVRCGNERHHASLGLFTGYSGMAYQQLRCEAPAAYPSVLTFAPPIR
jgi:lantibiotic modifying enzyme